MLNLYKIISKKFDKSIIFSSLPLLNHKKLAIMTLIGEMAEWSKAAVLKTVEGNTSGGSNPSLSATLYFKIISGINK